MKKLVMLLAFLCLAPSGIMAQIVEIPESNFEAPSENLGFVPAILPSPTLWIDACQTPRRGESCLVDIEVKGYGSRDVWLARRMTTGVLQSLRHATVEADGHVRFYVIFQETGTQNLLLFVLNRKGFPIAMDGVVLSVEPPKDQLGSQSLISGDATGYYYSGE
jgi:hypothetical protein